MLVKIMSLLGIFSFKWIITSLKEVLGEVLSWLDGDEEEEEEPEPVKDNVENDIVENDVETEVSSSCDETVSDDELQPPSHELSNEFKNDLKIFSLPFMAFLDIWDKITSNNSKRIYNKMNSNNDNFCVGDKELHERAAAYLYDECMDKCNMKEMNQVACLLMLMINGRVKCDKEKKKNMLLFLKKFVIFSRSFTDEQCKGMSYPINLLCLIYRNNDYLRELSLERPLIPLDTEFHYLKKIITDAHHRYL